MARILVLTDRPQTDDGIVSRMVELVDCLESGEISVVVTRSADSFLVGGYSLGTPDLILPDSSSVWAFSRDSSDVAAAKQFLTRCRREAALHGQTCETARSDRSLMCTASLLANVAGLVVVSREILLDGEGKLMPLRMLWREVQRPWLICPMNTGPWKRIVVASRNDVQRNDLIAWGRHWSERIAVPLTLIELGTPPPWTVWSAVTQLLSWRSSRRQRAAACAGLLACGLGPNDLLLVDRMPASWPHLTDGNEVSLDDLVAIAPCSVGVAPVITSAATSEILFSHWPAQMDGQSVDITAA